MAKVLLVDTNFSSLPIYRALLAMEHEVHVTGRNPNDCLAKVSPNYWRIDYSDTDDLGELIEREQFDHLVPGCTDLSYLSCVAVGQGRFPGLDHDVASDALFNKSKFRELCERIELSTPARHPKHAMPPRWPVIVKPVDSFSGSGITVIQEKDKDRLGTAIETARAASSSGGFLIESFVSGQLYSHSAFLTDRKIVRDFIVREDCIANKFVVDTSRVVDPAPSDMLRSLRVQIERMADALDLADGLVHTQFIGSDESIFLIEVTRRCPGDLYSLLIESSTDYPYARAYAMPFLGMKVPVSQNNGTPKPILRHTITAPTAQSFSHLHFKIDLKIEHWTPLSLSGEQLQASPKGRVGVLLCRAKDSATLDALYETILRRELYDICA